MFDASVAWLERSKEPMYCWLVALEAYKTQFYYWLGWAVCETQRCVVLTVDDLVLGYVLACYLLSALWNHAQLGGGSDAERFMSTLAYGWVERCSDVASCGPTSFLNKSSCVFNIFNELFMN